MALFANILKSLTKFPADGCRAEVASVENLDRGPGG
jgi:hypothetical protein